jgi:4-hydroxy-tetrahydrodipicolinate synthase
MQSSSSSSSAPAATEPAFRGVFSVLPTPFDSSGELDLPGLGRVIDLYLGAGVNGLTALGVTSEVARLEDRERSILLDAILKRVDGRVPVVAGATSNGLRTTIAHTRSAKAAGAAAVMVSPPQLARPAGDTLAGYYASLASAVDIPIVLQDFPPVSGFTMEPAILARIAREVPAVRAIKLEDPPTPWKTARILTETGPKISILGGLGGVFLLEELLAGASGTMTGFAYPEILVRIVALFQAGKVDEATDIFYRYVPLMRFEFQQLLGISLRKHVLVHRGAITDATIRAPGAKPDAATLAALDRLLGWLRQTYKEDSWISI